MVLGPSCHHASRFWSWYPGIQDARCEIRLSLVVCFPFFPSLLFHVSCASSSLALLSAVRRLLNPNIRASGNKLDTSDRYAHSCIFCALQFIKSLFSFCSAPHVFISPPLFIDLTYVRMPVADFSAAHAFARLRALLLLVALFAVNRCAVFSIFDYFRLFYFSIPACPLLALIDCKGQGTHFAYRKPLMLSTIPAVSILISQSFLLTSLLTEARSLAINRNS